MGTLLKDQMVHTMRQTVVQGESITALKADGFAAG
jgi:hypothetical protein